MATGTFIKPSPDIQSDTFTVTIGTVSSSNPVRKYGDVVWAQISVGDGTAFSSLSGVDTIATIPEGFRPSTNVYGTVIARTSGAWGSSTYYTVLILISTDGSVSLRGNASSLHTCQYITGAITWVI